MMYLLDVRLNLQKSHTTNKNLFCTKWHSAIAMGATMYYYSDDNRVNCDVEKLWINPPTDLN